MCSSQPGPLPGSGETRRRNRVIADEWVESAAHMGAAAAAHSCQQKLASPPVAVVSSGQQLAQLGANRGGQLACVDMRASAEHDCNMDVAGKRLCMERRVYPLRRADNHRNPSGWAGAWLVESSTPPHNRRLPNRALEVRVSTLPAYDGEPPQLRNIENSLSLSHRWRASSNQFDERWWVQSPLVSQQAGICLDSPSDRLSPSKRVLAR